MKELNHHGSSKSNVARLGYSYAPFGGGSKNNYVCIEPYSSLSLDNKTHEEDLSRDKLEVIYLRIFVCPMYIHIPKEKRTKLDPSGRNELFVGYNDISKSY